MRSKLLLALGVAALGGTSACVDLDEEIVSGVTTSYYETPGGLNDAVNATYAGLWDLYGQERHMTLLEYGVDIWAGGADGSRKYFNQYTSQLEPRESWLADQWNALYRWINTANAVIGRAGEVEGLAEETRTLRVAEAKFLRALYYFYTIRQFGDAVLSLEIVMADGRVIRTGGRNVKDVAGYSLTHLVVGSQGTLAIVTEATLRPRQVRLRDGVRQGTSHRHHHVAA